ncbi:SDR family NAD(P)-dependent oxidoreductase, partial [Curtobacterium sp. PsM8]|nr:SDR family NAD(P)-dependent oxidoreductase [Curtobacterium sp. PsM8]
MSYQREALDEANASRQRWQPEPWQADALVSTYTAIADGSLRKVYGDLERVTRRPPIALRQVL